MLHLKNNIHILTRTKSLCTCTVSLQKPAARSFTSSFINKKIHSNNNQSRTSACQEKDDICSDSQDPFVAKTSTSTSTHNLSFMPVVNIPQTEFAHSAFFSLHRPLAGLTGNNETDFFSIQPSDEENVDEQIAEYMDKLLPFEPPVPPGTPTDQDKGDTIMNNSGIDDSIEMEENYYLDQLPVYYMPESDDLMDYLSTLQERLVRQSAYDHITTASNLGRTKQRHLIASPSAVKQQTLGSASSPSKIPSRYQKWNRQGLYRHRWNK